MDPNQLRSLLEAITNAVQGNNAAQSHHEGIQLESFNEENESWEIFVKRLENFFCLKNLTGDTNEVKESKRNWLVHAMGAKTLQLLCNLTSPEDPKTKSYDELITLVKDHLHPAPSVIAEQNRFTKRVQHEGESISNFVADLKKMCKNCNFICTSCNASTADAHLRQQFISGLRNAHWLEKLIQLQEPKNKFTDCVTATLAMESAQKDSKEIQNLQATSNNYQNQISITNKPKRINYPSNYKNQKGINNTQKHEPTNSSYCFRCGDKDHLANSCKHNRTICSKCQKAGHLARVCMSSGSTSNKSHTPTPVAKPKKRNYSKQNQLHSLSTPSDDEEQEDYYMNQLSKYALPEERKKPKKFMLSLVLDGVSKQLELDTGAAVSSISYHEFVSTWPAKQMHESNVPFQTYTGEIIQPVGYTTFHVRYGNEEANANMYIMPGRVDAIFGREWLKFFNIQLPKLNHVSDASLPTPKEKILHALKTKFSDVFLPGVGKINNFEATLFVDDNAKPIYIPARKIPYALQEKMKLEIDRLESEGIITKMQYSEWGTPVVPIMKKDGSMRLCADYKITLNKVLKNDHFPIPHVEDIFATSMLGGKIFTTLDLSEAYLHMPMDIRSAEMQAISTIKGDYKVNRLMFGTKVAPAIWQRYITQTLDNIPGVCVFLDDIKIQGSTLDEHTSRLEEVLRRLNNVGLRIKLNKCKFFESSITYLGHVISEMGLKKTKDKIQAITDAPAPRNITEVRSWLGLVNYYGRFLKNLSSKLHPLYKLLQNDVTFNWNQECEQAFKIIKSEITSDVVLCAYDPNLPLSLATDASPYGLGAVLSHTFPDGQERPIAYASRSLSASERNYSQIDKEATSIFWALKRFFRYCYGRKFSLITDHKPLVAIFSPSKSLPSMVATRMLHYAQFLQGFNYDIVYRATDDHGNADALSRLPLKLYEPKDADDVTYYQMQQMDIVPVTQKQIAEETSRDPLLKEVYTNLLSGKKLVSPGFEGKDLQFSLTNGTILRNNRVVIPATLRETILAELHTAHVGIVKMKALARSYVWWPHIDVDIEDLAKKCLACRNVQNQPSKKAQHPWEYPSTPWQRVHVDFAGPFFEKYFLIVVDAHSKWPEIFQTNNMRAAKTIEILRELFARYGLPLTLVSDNGPTFTSREFRSFIRGNGINHKFTAPYHPATNGQAERFVQNMKVALRKMIKDPGNISDKLSNYLMRYRKTPNSTTGVAPCTLFLQRDIRIRLDLVRSNSIDKTKEKLSGPYPSGIEYYPGDKVQVRNYTSKDRKWVFGKILRQDGLLHYFIDVHGSLWRRHVDQILKCSVDPTQVPRDPEVMEQPPSSSSRSTGSDSAANTPTQAIDYGDPQISQSSGGGSTTELSPLPSATQGAESHVPGEEVAQRPSSLAETHDGDGGVNHSSTVRKSSRIRKPVDRWGYAAT